MERQDYFLVACIPGAADLVLGKSLEITQVLARLKALSEEEATAVWKAVDYQASQMEPRPFVAVESESETRKDMPRFLLWCREARKTEEFVSATSEEILNQYGWARLAIAAKEYHDEVCRSRVWQDGDSKRSERFDVYDDQAGKFVIFDAANTERWGPVREHEEWSPLDDELPVSVVEATLYRHASGQWTHVSEEFYTEAPRGCGPVARRLTDAEAADWLVRHDFDPPSDVSQLAAKSLFTPGPPMPREQTESDRQGAAKPRWDSERRELWLAGRLCKRFKQPAPNQTRILDAFEESGWPSRIDDPIPPRRDSDQRQRLADAVRGLNLNKVVLFELDGTGEGVIWKPIQQEPEDDGIPF